MTFTLKYMNMAFTWLSSWTPVGPREFEVMETRRGNNEEKLVVFISFLFTS